MNVTVKTVAAPRAFAGALLLASLAGPGYGGDLHARLDVAGISYPTSGSVEGRARLFAQYEAEIGEHWFLTASAHLDGLTGDDRKRDGIVRPLETYIERRGDRLEFRLGFSNIAWGVLDEIAPQDVINPIGISRFALEGRAEARLPVPLARMRVFLPAEVSIEGVLAPGARRGSFDQLDEAGSPFAPPGLVVLPRSDLPIVAANMEGGLRVRGTTARVDWGASAYRDVVDFDRYTVSATGLVAGRPRRLMIGGDLETAIGPWVIRGEGAVYVDDPLQAESVPVVVTARSFRGGVGADRRVGENTLFFNALYRLFPEHPLLADRREISLVGGLSREFSRGTRSLRFFGLWNVSEHSGFTRAIWSEELVAHLGFEVGGGAFLGDGGEVLGLLGDCDFVIARLRLSR